MSVKEIKSAVNELSNEDLAQFAAWFAEYHTHAWDKQIERDLETGRLDKLLHEVDSEYEACEAKPL